MYIYHTIKITCFTPNVCHRVRGLHVRFIASDLNSIESAERANNMGHCCFA